MYYSQVREAYQTFIENIEISTNATVIKTPKCALLASCLRLHGNMAYDRSEYTKARILYTKNIAVAPPDSEELAMAFGNRSSVLLRLEKFYECLLDLNRALLCGKCPMSLKLKYIARKKVCVQKIKERNCSNAIALVSFS